jgi:endonuclease G, mitochondrial
MASKKKAARVAVSSKKKAKSAASASVRAAKNSAALMEKLKRFVRAKAEGYLEDPNVTSVGIGYKAVAGKKTKQLAIQFSVGSKVAPESLSAMGSRLIPSHIDVEGTSVPTDVIERSYKPSYEKVAVIQKDDRKARADTLQPGMSVGSVTTSAGTIGTFVRDRRDRRTVLLSNWHVLHGPNGKLGDDIVQPGKFDDNRVEQNKIGKLLRSHLAAAGDCAIASITGRQFKNEVLELGTAVGSIGDPELDDRVVKSGRTTGVTRGIVTRLEVNTRLDYSTTLSAVIGGFEIGPDPDHAAPDNEISRGGDSGSVWFAVGKDGKPTDVMLGLHFAGDADGTTAEFALACYAKSVMNKLEIEPIGPVTPQAVADDVSQLRHGFDKEFLRFAVNAPTFTRRRKDDLARLEDDEEIRYCHFSVWLSKERHYPTCVAWNIDGGQFKRVKRVGFRVDRRGDLEDYQLTNEVYRDNVLDRGHIARRADLCWGSPEEAKQGNYDSCYYSNIAPQHKAFNQSDDTSGDPDGGLWGRLENTIFDSEDPHDFRVSVMAGPVIGSGDRRFSQGNSVCFLPKEYWKVVAYVDDEDNKEKVFGFLLTQASLIDGLARPEGLDFDAWLWARITLRDLQDKTGVIFPQELLQREVGFVAPQALDGRALSLKPLYTREEYFAG